MGKLHDGQNADGDWTEEEGEGWKEGKLEKQSQREREREVAADRAPRPSAINDSWLPPLQGFAIGCGGGGKGSERGA